MTFQIHIDTRALDLIIHDIIKGYDSNLTDIIYKYKNELEEVVRELEKKEIYYIHEIGNTNANYIHMLSHWNNCISKEDRPILSSMGVILQNQITQEQECWRKEICKLLKKHVKQGYLLYKNNRRIPSQILREIHVHIESVSTFKLFVKTTGVTTTFHHYDYERKT